MASELIAHSALWAIDSEPIRAQGIIVKDTYKKYIQDHITKRDCACSQTFCVFFYFENGHPLFVL